MLVKYVHADLMYAVEEFLPCIKWFSEVEAEQQTHHPEVEQCEQSILAVEAPNETYETNDEDNSDQDEVYSKELVDLVNMP